MSDQRFLVTPEVCEYCRENYPGVTNRGVEQRSHCRCCGDSGASLFEVYEAFVREASKKDFPSLFNQDNGSVNLVMAEQYDDELVRDLMIAAAEVGDAVKKGKSDEEVLIECGDLAFYLVAEIMRRGSSLEEVLVSNMKKLRERQGKK